MAYDVMIPLGVLAGAVIVAIGVFSRFSPGRLSLDADIGAYEAHRALMRGAGGNRTSSRLD